MSIDLALPSTVALREPMKDLMPRETFGWVSPRSRTVLLGAGWAVLAFGLGSVTYGLVTGSGLMLVVGLLASTLAWWLSASLPEPDPAPHRTERRRREAIRRFSDHPVYVSGPDTKP